MAHGESKPLVEEAEIRATGGVPAEESQVPPDASFAASRTIRLLSRSGTDPSPESVLPRATAGMPSAIPGCEPERTPLLNRVRNLQGMPLPRRTRESPQFE